MKSLGRRVEPRAPSSPDVVTIAGVEGPRALGTGEPRPLGEARWDWTSVRRVLVIRLRSIGDTVLATPSLVALKRFLPDAQIDILLEDWVAPLLDGLDYVDNGISMGRGRGERLKTARRVRRNRYDIVFN